MKILRDEFKLSFTDVEFHTTVSRKTGKVVVACTLKGYIQQPEMVDEGYTLFTSMPYWCGASMFSVTAKAVCSVNDTSEVEIGKAVAQAKAESKCYATMKKRLHERITTGCSLLTVALNKFEKKANMVVAHNEEYINQVSDPSTDLYKRRVKAEA